MIQHGSPVRVAAGWGAMLAVLLALTVLSLYLMNGHASRRLTWAVWSALIWMIVVCVVYVAKDQIHDAASAAVRDEAREREAEVQRIRAELNRFPDWRRAVVDRALIDLRKHVATSPETLERVLVFGDPTTAPADVVVWGVLSVRPESSWARFGLHGQKSHNHLNWHLRQRGYPFRIALGFAPTEDVDRAGGDEAYFGPGGSAVSPQFRPGRREQSLEVPRRR